MTSQYIYNLHVIAPNLIAQNLSDASYGLCPDIGENNVNIQLNELGDESEPSHFGFSAPVTQNHIDALFGAGLGSIPGVRWARTDRTDGLIKRYDNENPEYVLFTFNDLLNENNLKIRTPDSIY